MNFPCIATLECARAGGQWVDSTATKSQLMTLLRERALCSDLGRIFPAHGTAFDGIVASLTRMPIPLALIERIVRLRVKQNAAKAAARRKEK